MTDPRNTRQWKELAERIKERDGYQCVVNDGCDGALSVDHIIPISKGGAVWDEDNLVTMCMKHNRQKSNKTEGQVTDWINPLWLEWENRT